MKMTSQENIGAGASPIFLTVTVIEIFWLGDRSGVDRMLVTRSGLGSTPPPGPGAFPAPSGASKAVASRAGQNSFQAKR